MGRSTFFKKSCSVQFHLVAITKTPLHSLGGFCFDRIRHISLSDYCPFGEINGYTVPSPMLHCRHSVEEGVYIKDLFDNLSSYRLSSVARGGEWNQHPEIRQSDLRFGLAGGPWVKTLGQPHLHHLTRQWSDNKQFNNLIIKIGMVGYGIMKDS
jgi:hypothetical protein